MTPSIVALTDRELLEEGKRLAAAERHETAALIAVLGEIDSRRAYLAEGFSSLFAYCTAVLHMSEHAAYGRIEAARTARRCPAVLRKIADGDVTLTALSLVSPHLTPANHATLLDSIRHKTRHEVERIVAGLAPRPDVPDSIRKLPSPAPPADAPCPTSRLLLSGRSDSAPEAPQGTLERAQLAVVPTAAPSQPAVPPRAVIAPLAPGRYKIQVTVSRETHDKLRRAQDLLRHAMPNGDLAEVVDRALTLLVAQLEKQKWAACIRPRPETRRASHGRTIPAGVRRAVSRRDAGRCAFVGTLGRCTQTTFLEFHHVVPFARGGGATEENIQLRCRAHNQHEGREVFGPFLMREHTPVSYDAADSGRL